MYIVLILLGLLIVAVNILVLLIRLISKKPVKKAGILIVVGLVLALIGFFAAPLDEPASVPDHSPENTSSEPMNSEENIDTEVASEELVYEDDYVKFTVVGADANKLVTGCFYVTLKLENKLDDVEVMYSLDDCYVDDLHCNTGSGMPVTAKGGKKVNGAFIVFFDGDLEEVSEIEFRVLLMDYDSLDTLHRTETITIAK